MATPLLRTKLYVPPVRPDLAHRPRLLHRLDEGLRLGHGLTLLSAPAGFGKTTLLSEWVAACGRPVAWVSLDKGDNDPARFWAYFIAALQTIEANIGEGALGVLLSPQPPPIEPLLTGLINEIAEVPHPFALFLDDFHVISAPQLNDAFTFLLDNLPPQMQVILSGRADPPWPLARYRARGEMTELRADDLRFTPQEATTFLNQVMKLDLSPGDVAALEERTEGWIAGLQMAALSMRGRKDVSGFIKAFSGTHRFILDYLVEEVLDRQSSDIQEFLLRTSILERMTGPLCDAVTGGTDSQMLLTQLEQANLFLSPLDDERRWYRYHRLFADLLHSRLEHTQPGHVSALHRLASEWYESASFVEEAVTHAFAGQDLERAASLVEQNAMRMIIDGKHPTVSRWLELLPADLVWARPWLCVYHAWTQYWTGLRELVEDCLENAEQALAGTPNRFESEKRSTKVPVPAETEGPALSPSASLGMNSVEGRHMAGYIAALRACSALTDEDIPRVFEMAQRAVELLPEGDYMQGLVGIALGNAHGSQGDVVAAQRAYAEASASAQKRGYRTLSVSATCYLGMAQAKQARLHEALATYRQALELAIGPGGRQLLVGGLPLVKLGDLSREWNDLATASRELTKGVQACAQWGQPDFLADGYVALARLQLAQGDLAGARETLQEATHLARRSKVDVFVLCWLDECRLRLWLSEGNLAAAMRWAKTSGLTVDDELIYHHDLHHINLARVLVAQGMRQPSGNYLHEALDLLARLLAAAEKSGWIHEEIKILILQALALDAGGDTEEAIATLTRALMLAEQGGYVRVFVDEGAPMHKLLHQAAAEGIAPEYVSKLLAACDVSESGSVGERFPRTRIQPLIEPLSERELEVLRLLATGLSTSGIAQELFVAVSTLRSHAKSIYSKLNVHSRHEAVARAKELNLL